MSWFPRLEPMLICVVGLGVCLSPAISRAQAVGAQPATDAGYRIAGTIVNGLGGAPLRSARVTVVDTSNPRNSRAEITSEDGHFEFTQLAAGKYSLQGAKRSFIGAGYDQHEQFSTAIVTGAGLDTEHLVLRLSPFAVLSGKVFDEAGEPVRQANVALYREDRRTGVGRIQRMRDANTDDQGSYEFTPLSSGIYFLSVAATPWYAVHARPASSQNGAEMPSAIDRSLDVAYPLTYYKDATEPDEASPIPIRGGDRLEVDIHLDPVPALRLLVHVPDNGAHGFSSPLLQRPSLDGMQSVQSSGVEMVSQGVYAMMGVPAGRYAVRSFATPGQGEPPSDIEMDLSEDGQELDAAKGVPASSVKASVQMRAGVLPQQLLIGLWNGKTSSAAGGAVSDKGEVEFHDVVPGKYEVLAQAAQESYSVVHISIEGGGEVSGDTLSVAAGASLTVALTVAGSALRVEGFVKHTGKAAPGAMVVLVPNDPESNRQLFRRDQSDLDGSFSLRGVIPGSYTVVAIENGWDLDWSSPGVITHYCQKGQPVKVEEMEQGLVHLRDVVEVQPR